MITILAILGTLYAAGALVLFVGARLAPEGWEDESGFHLVWRNNDPDRADVACIWSDESAPAAA